MNVTLRIMRSSNIESSFNLSTTNDANYTGSFDLSNFETGEHIISYRAIDNVGNVEEINTKIVEIKATPDDGGDDGGDGDGTTEPNGLNIELILIISIIAIGALLVCIIFLVRRKM